MTQAPAIAGPLDAWMAGMACGFRRIRRDPVAGAKRLLLPVSYWRSVEFSYVGRWLTLPEGSRVLDVGSPKDLALMLSNRRQFELVSTDILELEVDLVRRWTEAEHLPRAGAGSVSGEVQDARALSFPDESFDAAFSVSVLEHIPETGDSAAIREIVRVVKPGGVVVVTVPFDRIYRETFVESDVYERKRTGDGRVFFERHYDAESLQQRLLSVPGVELLDLQIWGEGGVRMERILGKLGPLRTLCSPGEAFLAAAFLRQCSRDPNSGCHPMAAFFALRRLDSAQA